ncbi:MAG: hypothetical protein KGM24_08770 [Elusimicrobia bacterium]|nr:hypothetical protein [Elusimicrobiota bacterium]
MRRSFIERRLFLALAVLLPAACGSKPTEFPVGFFGVSTPAQARFLAARGYDAIQSYDTDPAQVAALARQTRRDGQLLLVAPFELMKSTYPARDFRGAVWYLADEPDVHKISDAELVARDAKTKAWAPGSKSAFVLGDATKAKAYPRAGDYFMEDRYPIAHRPITLSGDMVRDAAQAADGRRVWAVLQAMDWRDVYPHNPAVLRVDRFPTLEEIRFLSYDAVLNGAQGVWYFAYSTATDSDMSGTPEHLFAVDWSAREMRALAPVFARGRPIPVPFSPLPDGMAAKAWTYHGRDYVVLEDRLPASDLKVPAGFLRPEWRPLFEARRDAAELLRPYDGNFYLRAHQVLVLESRLKLRRLLGL